MVVIMIAGESSEENAPEAYMKLTYGEHSVFHGSLLNATSNTTPYPQWCFKAPFHAPNRPCPPVKAHKKPKSKSDMKLSSAANSPDLKPTVLHLHSC